MPNTAKFSKHILNLIKKLETEKTRQISINKATKMRFQIKFTKQIYS